MTSRKFLIGCNRKMNGGTFMINNEFVTFLNGSEYGDKSSSLAQVDIAVAPPAKLHCVNVNGALQNGIGGAGISTGIRSKYSGRPKCTKCGRPLRPLGNTVNINDNLSYCSTCQIIHSKSSSDFARRNSMKQQDQSSNQPPFPIQIKAYLDEHVIGQENAKITLSQAVYEHYLRINNNERLLNKQGNFMKVSTSLQADYSPAAAATAAGVPPHSNVTGLKFVPEILEQTNRPRSYSTNLPPPIQQESTPYIYATSRNLNVLNDPDDIRLEKSNIILLGPSGVGKTFITQKLAELLDVPVALCDCTTMTQAGYVGDDVEIVLQRLLQNANGDLQRAQRGIVFLDEMDKIASTRESSSHAYRDVSGEGVQHAMLKMVEGTVVNVKNGKRGQQDTVPMDTTDILFIASGAFTGLERVVSRRLDKRTVGFGAPTLDNTITADDKEQQMINEKRDKLLNRVDQGDMIKFGMIPELVGRFPRIVPFHSLCKQSLVRVLTEPSNALLKQEQKYFELHDARLEFADDALEEIAQKALESKTGARALKSILGKILTVAKYSLPGSDIESVLITKECVRGNADCEMTKRQMAATTTG